MTEVNPPGVYVDVLAPLHAGVAKASGGGIRTVAARASSRLQWRGEHSVAAFLGVCDSGPLNAPVLLHDSSQFLEHFGECADTYLRMAVNGYFNNGGSRCYVVRLEDWDILPALGELDRLHDLSLVCAPDLVLCDDLHGLADLQLQIVDACHRAQDRFAILDSPPGLPPLGVREWRTDVCGLDSALAALYYPWLRVTDPVIGGHRAVPSSGHIAGLMARVDASRGFHHSPGNEAIRDAEDLEVHLTQKELQLLYPLGINGILGSPSRGPVVWGSRTLSSDPDWRYIRRSRLVLFLLRAIRRQTNWVILTRGDADLRSQVAEDLADLLDLLWRGGALYGDAAQDAYALSYEDGPDEARFAITCAVAADKDLAIPMRVRYVLEG